MRFMRFDRWGAYVGDLDPVKAVRTRNVDGTDKLSLTLLSEVDKDDRVVARDSMGRLCEWLVQSTDTARSDSVPACTVSCVSSAAELSRSYIDAMRRGTAKPASEALSRALEGTRWAAGTVGSGTADYSFYHTDVLSAIQSVCDAYGLEAEFSVELSADGLSVAGRTVSLPARRGRAETAQRFEYGADLAEVRRTISADDVVTRAYGYGKGLALTDDEGEATGGYSRKITFGEVNGGLDYVEDAEATKAWGVVGPDGGRLPAVGVYEDGDCEDPAQLLSETRAWLAAHKEPQVSYDCTVAALGRAGVEAEGVDVGDAVQIVDATFEPALRLSGRVLEIEEDMVGSLADTKITLGNVIEGRRRRDERVQQALDQMSGKAGAWDSAAGLGASYLEGIIEGVNGVMDATGGYAYLVPGKGLVVYDKPEDENPTMCIQLGGGYFRIADGKKADGTWDFRTLGNGHGLVADALYAGTIKGGSNTWNLETGDLLFRQGVIRSANGLSSWNLTDNTFTTRGMTANDITANGTFECGSTSAYGIKLNSTGQLAGYRQGSQVGYIDYSAAMTYNPTGEILHGLKMQAEGVVRISTPQVSISSSSDTSVTTTAGFTGTLSQPIVTEVHDNGNGSVGWHYGTLKLNFINGLLTGYTTVNAS